MANMFSCAHSYTGIEVPWILRTLASWILTLFSSDFGPLSKFGRVFSGVKPAIVVSNLKETKELSTKNPWASFVTLQGPVDFSRRKWWDDSLCFYVMSKVLPQYCDYRHRFILVSGTASSILARSAGPSVSLSCPRELTPSFMKPMPGLLGLHDKVGLKQNPRPLTI